MAWMIHLKTGPQGLLKPLDLAIRLAVIAALVLAAGAALAGVIDAPVFIALKYLLLAAAVVCGLLIRAALAPFFQVVGALAAGMVSDAQNALVRQALGRVRLIVLVIWALISAAALLGVYTPAL